MNQNTENKTRWKVTSRLSLQSLSKTTDSIHGHLSWKINHITYNRFMEYISLQHPKSFNWTIMVRFCLYAWVSVEKCCQSWWLMSSDFWKAYISMFWVYIVMKIILLWYTNGTNLLKLCLVKISLNPPLLILLGVTLVRHEIERFPAVSVWWSPTVLNSSPWL